MTSILAGITTSLDGYITGPNDGPAMGLGEGGERLHYWVFGGPWTYDDRPDGEATGVDRQVLDEAFERAGAVICGRGMFEAAGRWGGTNPFPVPTFVLTHHPDDVPHDRGFTFVTSLDEAVGRATEAAGGKDVAIGGGGDTIRQALRAGIVDELTVTIAPVILGGGKRLFDGFDQSIDLEHVRTLQSPLASHLTYRVRR